MFGVFCCIMFNFVVVFNITIKTEQNTSEKVIKLNENYIKTLEKL